MREGAGAPKGNQNASKQAKRVWLAAIERALKKRSLTSRVEALDELAEKLLQACDKGDVPALKELGDRLEGKPIQQIEASGPNGGPIQVQKIEVLIVDPASTGSAEA
jgi:hypothetical protein